MEGSETVLDWTVPNWITVCLMVILGFAVLGCVARITAKVLARKEQHA